MEGGDIMQTWISWMKQQKEKAEAELKLVSELREKVFVEHHWMKPKNMTNG
jgi:hypothetical protein